MVKGGGGKKGKRKSVAATIISPSTNLRATSPTEELLDGVGGVEPLSPRLLALQQQLERLDHDRSIIPADVGALTASASRTELSLASLKRRLSEVRQQLYGTPASPPTSLASLAKSYFGGMLRGPTLGFPGEGDAFDEEFDGDLLSESDGLYTEELAGAEESASEHHLLDATRLGLNGFFGNREAELDILSTAEAELQAALDVVAAASPNAAVALRDKFEGVLQQDRHWRGRVQTATRLAHDERIQRQLVEMELDKANAIKHRLESLCRDLHNENRRIKAEHANHESAPSLEFSDIAKEKEFDDGKAYSTIHGQDITSKSPLSESTTTIMDSVTTTTQSSTSKSSNNLSDPPVVRQGEFVLPSAALDKELLAMEPSATLVDRIVTLAELYLSREQHFAAILRQKETALLNESEKAAMLVSQLGAQTTALDNHSRRISVLTRSESELKAQVRQYVDKFRQVEETLGKSNDLFSTFRAEMEQMGAKLARLERENAQLNSKCATLSRNIIEMADERTKQNAALETIKGQKAKLEGLCRTLQAERNAAAKTCPHGSETAQGQESQTDLTEPPVTTASNQ